LDIIITEWALDSYLELYSRQAFTRGEYQNTIRPDAERLRNYPADPRFQNNKFWSPAVDRSNLPIPDGYKMKWHNMGNGKVQLRLPTAILSQAHLCEAYVKENPKQEMRKMARFKTHLQLIRAGRFTERGRLP
jgi:hypothetical protein